jgi:protein-disulfide isomerase
MDRSSLTVPVAILAAGAILALAVYAYYSGTAPKAKTPGDPSLVRPVGAGDHILGNPAARAKIVEYSDFDCTYCKTFHQTLSELIANEGDDGRVAWVFREFPLAEIHENALTHAIAAECVAQISGNDAFWKFADALFAKQPADPKDYGALALAAGVPGDSFSSCYTTASSTVIARIRADRQNAIDVGARGTPYSLLVVDGKAPVVLEGAYSYDALKDLVAKALGN